MLDGELTGRINAAAIEVHRTIGPGLLESAYQVCLAHELKLRGLHFEKELKLPISHKGVTAESGYRLDFLVERRVIIEVKACAAIEDVHTAQLLTYLRLSGHRVGLLYNFHSPKLMTSRGLKRVVI